MTMIIDSDTFNKLPHDEKLSVIYQNQARLFAHIESESGTSDRSLGRLEKQLTALDKRLPQRINGARGFMAERLKLNIGTVVSLGSLLIACTMWLSSQLTEIKQGWKVSQQRAWAYRLHLANVALNIPDVDEIARSVP